VGAAAPFGAFAPEGWRKTLISFVRATPVLRRGSFRPKWAKLLGAGPFDVERDGGKFRLVLDTNPIEWGALLMPGYEGPERAFLRGGLKDGDTLIDIGANFGFYALTLAPIVGPKGRVIAFEVDPKILPRVAENVRLNAFPQVTLIQAAAGDHDGEARFNAKLNPAHSGLSAEGNVVAPMRTLLSVLNEHGVTRIDALKIDVEGGEDQVLLPFFDNAPKSLWPKRVVIEDIFIDSGADNSMKRMKSLGYREVGRVRINTFLVLD
jgi:FkbM family methyltransferase